MNKVFFLFPALLAMLFSASCRHDGDAKSATATDSVCWNDSARKLYKQMGLQHLQPLGKIYARFEIKVVTFHSLIT